jgi:hypothetical protein
VRGAAAACAAASDSSIGCSVTTSDMDNDKHKCVYDGKQSIWLRIAQLLADQRQQDLVRCTVQLLSRVSNTIQVQSPIGATFSTVNSQMLVTASTSTPSAPVFP